MSDQGAIAEAVAAALAARGMGGAPAPQPGQMGMQFNGGAQQGGGMGGMGGFGAPTANPTGFLVGLNIPTPAGKVKCFLSFPADVAANPNAALMVIQSLMNAGWPVDAYVPKQQGGGWGGGGGGGGYGRGGSYGGGGGGRW